MAPKRKQEAIDPVDAKQAEKVAEKVAEVAAAVISAPVLGETTEDALTRMAYESKCLLFKNQLSNPWAAHHIKWKPQMVKGNRCLAIAYIDARLIQDRLDDVCGVDGWEDDYIILDGGNVMCKLTLKRTPSGVPVTKCDVGGPSEQPDPGDRMKSAFSDALKRAAIKFGIGRYLYRIPHQWVDYDSVKKRIAQIPQLPAFAMPRKEVPDLPQYHDPGEVIEPGEEKTPEVKTANERHKEASKAVVETAKAAIDEDADKKKAAEVAAAASAKRTAEFITERLKWWAKSMEGCDTVSQLTELISDNLKDESMQSKPKVWDCIQSWIKGKGWKWDKNRKEVYEPDTNETAIPY